jgi:hypothetical protein
MPRSRRPRQKHHSLADNGFDPFRNRFASLLFDLAPDFNQIGLSTRG